MCEHRPSEPRVRRWVSRLAVTALLAWAPAAAVEAAADAPAGWVKEGNTPRLYRAGLDSDVARGGGASAYLRSWTASPPVYGTLMQRFSAESYRGKRLRLSGFLRTDDVEEGWAGLWLRVDDPEGKRIAFDNTQEEAVTGDSEWTRCVIVLDVPRDAEAIAFGFMLVGAGKVWADDLGFETVGLDVPVTAAPKQQLAEQPTNLDFEGADEEGHTARGIP